MPRWMSYAPSSVRKNRVYILTLVDRATSCISGCAMAPERGQERLQKMVDDAPNPAYYFSDLVCHLSDVDLHSGTLHPYT